MMPSHVAEASAKRQSSVSVLFLSYLFLLITASGIVQLWFWLLWPEYPLILKNQIKVINVDQLGVYNTVTYQMDYCKDQKFDDMEDEVHYVLRNHDGVIHELPGMTMGPLPYGCQAVKIAVVLPVLKPGVFVLRMARLYQVNPLKHISIISESQEFTILPQQQTIAIVDKPLSGVVQIHPVIETPLPKVKKEK